MVDAELHDRIEKYLLGELPSPDRERFEAEIAQNLSLAQQVEIQRLALIGLNRLAAADLRMKFDRWEEEMETSTLSEAPRPSGPNIWFWMAIGLLMLLILSILWHFDKAGKLENREKQRELEMLKQDSIIDLIQKKNQKGELNTPLGKRNADSLMESEINRLQQELQEAKRTKKEGENINTQERDNQALAMAYARSSEALRGNLNGSEQVKYDSILTPAYEAFNANRFSLAAKLLKKISPSDPRYRAATYKLPYALFYAGEFGEAVWAFESLKSVDRADLEKIQWFQLLCFVAEGRDTYTDKALNDIIANSKHQYHDDAVRLKGELQKK